MFKKFKDKLAEEMKQSPARLQASMQQLAQAVVSPALSNTSIQELSTSNDNFSLTEEGEDTPKNSPARHGFQNVDLMPSNSVGMSRTSSINSMTSDASSLFPAYESPSNLYHLQSDLESASEVDDNVSPQLEKISKEQLYSSYRKVQTKYHKYRERYMDLAKHYRELERVKNKLETVLIETQDKALRRIADLKEQCNLEQQAKTHLEAVLRNDIEERDHIINTLNTKVKYLQSNNQQSNNATIDGEQLDTSKTELINLTDEPPADSTDSAMTLLQNENTQLKEKLKRLESVVLKYKDSLKRNKEKFIETMEAKNALEQEHIAYKNASEEKLHTFEEKLNTSNETISNLKEEIDILKKREEESVLSLAENKLSIHRELEDKEEQIKKLRYDLKCMTESNEMLANVLEENKLELENLRSTVQEDANKDDKNQIIQAENENLRVKLQKKEIELQKTKEELNELQNSLDQHQSAKKQLQLGLEDLNHQYEVLKNEYNSHVIVTTEKEKEAKIKIEELSNLLENSKREMNDVKDALAQREQMYENLNAQVQEYSIMLEKAQERIKLQDIKMESSKSNDQEELENKNIEIIELQYQLETSKSLVSDLQNKLETISHEKHNLIENISHHEHVINKLKQDCTYLKNYVNKEFVCLNNLILTLHKSVGNLSIEKSNSLKDQESMNLSCANLEKELETCKKQLKEMEVNAEQYEKLNYKNKKLLAEIDNLYFKIHDLEQLREEAERIKNDAKIMEERLKTLENVEILNESLSKEIHGLQENNLEIERLTQDLEKTTMKYQEAMNTIESLKSKASNNDALKQEVGDLESKVLALENERVERDGELNELRSSLMNNEAVITQYKAACEKKDEIIEENTTKLSTLDEKYQRLLQEYEMSKTQLQKQISNEHQELIELKTVVQQILQINNICEEDENVETRIKENFETLQRDINKLRDENSQLSVLMTENKHLKDKQNEIMKMNEELRQMENNLRIQVAELEQEKQTTREEITVYKNELEKLRNELTEVNNSAAGLTSQIEEFKLREGQLIQSVDIFKSDNANLKHQISELTQNLDDTRHKYETTLSQLKSLETRYENLKSKEEEKVSLKLEIDAAKNQIRNLQKLETENNALKSKINELEDIITNKNTDLEVQVSSLDSENSRLKSELDKAKEFERVMNEKNMEIKSLEEKNSDLSFNMEELKVELSKLKNIISDNEKLKTVIQDFERTIAAQEEEMKSLREAKSTLEKDVRNNDGDLIEKNQQLQEANKKLEAQLDEALITFQSKESQMQLAYNELKQQTNNLTDKLKINEEEQNMRLKQLVKEFQAQLQDKDEELQSPWPPSSPAPPPASAGVRSVGAGVPPRRVPLDAQLLSVPAESSAHRVCRPRRAVLPPPLLPARASKLVWNG